MIRFLSKEKVVRKILLKRGSGFKNCSHALITENLNFKKLLLVCSSREGTSGHTSK